MSQNGSQVGSPSPGVDGSEDIANCLKAIEDNRGQHISKWEAISKITSAIQSITASMDDEQRLTARSTYLAMLDEHNRLLTQASLRGQPGHVEPVIREEQYEEVINSEAGVKHSHSRSDSPNHK